MNALQAASIRAIYPNEELYYIRIEYDEFVVRTITPMEYALIKDVAYNAYEEEDLVSQTGIVYPSEYNVIEGGAGIPGTLANVILRASMLTPDSKKQIVQRLEDYNNMMHTDIDSHLPVIIKMAFPEFTFEQIEAWNIDTQLKNLARALFCLKLKGIKDIQGYEIKDEEQPKLTLNERAAEMEKQGIDPVMALYDEYKTKSNIIDLPFIMGPTNWNNEDVIHAIQKQRRKR